MESSSVKYSLQKEGSKIFLMLYCGSVYDQLLHRCRSTIESRSQQYVSLSSEDSDDIYYCFEGAAISSMLHNRYAQIQGCACDKQQISLEISVL